ncbi:MAG: c-type cytochrome [Rhodospirillales bacterium]
MKRSVSLAVAAVLTMAAGDVGNGRAIVANRQLSACLLCHSGPFPDPHLQGNLAPSLDGAGSRLTEAELRRRLIAPGPDSIMPSYTATSGLQRVGKPWVDKSILTSQQIEDVVAFLATLRTP